MSSREGNWRCRECNEENYATRGSCQRCCKLKPRDSREALKPYDGFSTVEIGSSSASRSEVRSEVRQGDWFCAGALCGAHNSSTRDTCFQCGAMKTDLEFFDQDWSTSFNLELLEGIEANYSSSSFSSSSGWNELLGDDWLSNWSSSVNLELGGIDAASSSSSRPGWNESGDSICDRSSSVNLELGGIDAASSSSSRPGLNELGYWMCNRDCSQWAAIVVIAVNMMRIMAVTL
ncbi:hypothetical protein RIF29_28228 [Crotalaria pallida]|uniref:RanBP2-type domain-containing protein n=1 Tax=Crotalaria pallida TaxID=3830 RepID=A0AAN9ERN9_CROPI